VAIIYVTEAADPKQPLRVLGIRDSEIHDFLAIPSAAFRVAYGSEANRRTFDADTWQRLSRAPMVYAALVSPNDRAGSLERKPEGCVIVGDGDWAAVKGLAAIAEEYTRLQAQLEATENRCRGMERNSIRRRDMQESYEQLDDAISRLNDRLRGIALAR
jgi:hypothetical protein